MTIEAMKFSSVWSPKWRRAGCWPIYWSRSAQAFSKADERRPVETEDYTACGCGTRRLAAIVMSACCQGRNQPGVSIDREVAAR